MNPTPMLPRGDGEVGHLEPRARERVEPDREAARAVVVPEHHEGRLLGRRAVGNRLCRNVDVDRGADPLEDREHRRRPSRAVEPDDVGARVRDAPARLVELDVVHRRLLRRRCEGHDGGKAGVLDDLGGDQRLAEIVVRLGDDQLRAFLDRPRDLLAVHLAHDRAGSLGIRRVVHPGVADVPGKERVALGRHLARDPERVSVQRLEIVLAADRAHLLAMAVVRERDHDLGAGPQELAVQLADGVGEVEHDLGHIRPALEIAAPLELEQIALGTEHHAVVKSLEETRHGP